MRRTKVALLVPLLGLFTVDAALAAKAPKASPLQKIYEQVWQEDLVDDPINATQIGDHRYDDKLPDMSVEAIAARNKRNFTRLQSLTKLNRDKLEKAEQLNYDLFYRDIKGRIDVSNFKPEAYDFKTFSGPQLLSQLSEIAPFATAKDYDNWIARLNATGTYIDQYIVLLGQAVTEGRTQPKVTVEKVLDQIKAQLVTDPETSPFYAPFKNIPASVDAANKARLTAAGKTAVQTVAIPAFQRLDAFFRNTYLPAARDADHVGVWATPAGGEYYRNRIKYFTTIDNMNAVAIHNVGLEEVKRIRSEMEKSLENINFLGTLDQFLYFIRTDPRFYYKSSDELLAAYTKTARGIEPQLGKLFGKLPKSSFLIKPIPDTSAPTTTTAYYQPPAMDGSRQGVFYVNLYKPETRPTWEVEALTAHESVPGHHLQVSLGYEIPGLPDFRRNADYSAYIEGWALYSEKLGYDLGLYQDDFSKFGQLNYEMWRAVRLVVDTGMHELHWTRDQAIYYFKQNTGRNELDIQNEVDRYISWPGQALAYKLGQLKIQALRAEAEKALGDRFDIRAFHDQILGTGPLPLSVMETETRAWIAEQSARR